MNVQLLRPINGMRKRDLGETRAMKQSQTITKRRSKKKVQEAELTIGIDLGDSWSNYCVLDQAGEIVEEGRFRSTPDAITKHFNEHARARIAMEAGTHSIWVSELLHTLGHEVIVENVQELRAICHSDRKSDRVDAEKLARYARLDPRVLRPIAHRSVAEQQALTLVRARNVLVRMRTALVNAARALMKPCGFSRSGVLDLLVL
jgi:transposase